MLHITSKKLQQPPHLPDHLLAAYMFVFVFIEWVLLAIWGGISIPRTEMIQQDDVDNTQITVCSWGDHEAAFLITQAIYFVGICFYRFW
jgi:hypothetical protein